VDTKLFVRNQPGGLFQVVDRSAHTGNIWYVGSAATGATDGLGYGRNPDGALATFAYLITNATTIGFASGDEVIFLPGHDEDIANAQITISQSGCWFHAHEAAVGAKRPVFSYDHANASIDVTGDDNRFTGIRFRPSVTSVLIGLDLNTGSTGCCIEDCEFEEGEDGAGVDEFVIALRLQSGNHDTVLRRNIIRTHASATHATHAVSIAAASNRLVIEDNTIYGTFATGGIVEAAAGTQHVFRGNAVVSAGTNLSFHGSSTFAARSGGGSAGNEDAGAPEDTAANLIGRDDNDNAVATTNVAANADGSVLERLETVQGYTKQIFSGAAGTGAYPTGVTDDSMWAMLLSKSNPAAASSYDNTTDSLEALCDALTAGTGASTALGTAALDHIMQTADGTGAYPASAANDSVVAMVMSKSNPAAASSYDNTTDSLEAISDALGAGTGATAALAAAHLDHVFQTADGTGVYPASVAEDSALAMILSKSNPAVATSYSNLTDSLEAISDQGQKIDLVTLGTVAAGSMASIVERCCEKSDGAVLAGADAIFTIAGGPIYVESLVGIVTTVIGGASNAKYSITVTTPAATTDLSAAAVAIDADAEGTIYTNVGATAVFTATTAGFAVLGLIGGVADQPHWILPPGTINFTCDAARSGVVKFYLRYKPLSPNALVTAAA